MSSSLLGRREAFKPGDEYVAVGFAFIAPSLYGNVLPVITQDDDLVEPPYDGDTFAAQLDFNRLRQEQ